MNVIIPLAGKDAVFEKLGNAKALTEIMGKPLIQWISESRPFSYNHATFILLREHQKKFQIDMKIKELFGDKINIVWAEEMTRGAPQSVLLANNLINNEEELIIDLVDQYLDLRGFMEFIEQNNHRCDGIIPTFESFYWNRGYMLINANNHVIKIQEKSKQPISTHSTACVNYFRHGKDFVHAAEKMDKLGHTAANGAFLVSLAYNEMIDEGKKIIIYPCEFIATLGTIEGINVFEQVIRPLKNDSDKPQG